MACDCFRLPLLLVLTCGAFAGACSKDPAEAKKEHLTSAKRYADEGKHQEAILEYRNVLKIDPREGEARFQLAELQLKNGDVAGAYQEYVRAADLLPGRLDVQLKAGTLLLLTGQYEDAQTRALQILEKEPRNSAAQVLLGNAFAGLQDFDSAIKQLEQATQLAPGADTWSTLGTVQLARGKRAEAEQAFRRAVALDSKSVSARLSLANFLWGAGRPADAEAMFKETIAIDPQNTLANRGLAMFYVHTNRADLAEPYLKAAAAADLSDVAVTKLALADFYIVRDRHDEAVSVLKPLAARKGSATEAAIRLATIEHARGNRGAAHTAIDAALKADPRHIGAMLTKARLAAAEIRFDEAVKLASDATKIDPKSLEAHYALGLFQLGGGDRGGAFASFTEVVQLNPKAVGALLQLSRLQLATGKYDVALQLAQSAVDLAPHNADVQLALARALVATKQFGRAEPLVAALVAQHGNVPLVRSTAGMLAAAKRDWRSSRTQFEAAMAIDATQFEAMSGLVGVDVAQNRAHDARANVDRWMEANPKNAALRLLSAHLHVSSGEPVKAEEDFVACITLDPNNLGAYSQLGELLVRQGRLDAARTRFEEVTKRSPKDIAAHTMVGLLLEASGAASEARKRYELVLELEPQAAIAANNLATIYANSGENLDLALQLAQTAKAQLPDRHEVSDTVGWILLKRDQGRLAATAFREALDQDPKNPVYHYHLGLAYLKTGDKAKARVSLQQALALNERFGDADDARKALASL